MKIQIHQIQQCTIQLKYLIQIDQVITVQLTSNKTQEDHENASANQKQSKTNHIAQNNIISLNGNELGTFNKERSCDLNQIDLAFDNQVNQGNDESTPKKNIVKNPLRNKFMFWFMVHHAAFTDFILAYNVGLFNTLSDHMAYIYNWNDEEKTLHYSLINSLPQAAAAIVALFAGGWSARFGRRRMLILLFIVAIIGNAITLIANTVALQIGRIIVGFCFGGWASIGPLYSIEVACKQYKGISGILYSQYFGFGILLAFLLGYGLPSDPKDSATNSYWRFMYGLPIVLCLISILIFLLVFRDETAPYMMLHNKDEPNTKRVLNKYFVEEIANEEFVDLNQFAKQGNTTQVGWKQLFGPQYRSRVILVVFVTLGFNYIGCNAINIYSYNIIKESQGASTAQLFTAIMPIGDIIGPFFSFLLIERIGRKSLYLHGLLACMLTLITFCITGWADFQTLQKYLILLYKFIFSTSIAPVHWIYPSEILPPVGVGFFGFSYWLSSLSTVQFLPYLLDSQGAEITMIIFPIVSVFVMIYLIIFMKETTGKGKEQIERMFYRPAVQLLHTLQSGQIVSQGVFTENNLEDDKQNKQH